MKINPSVRKQTPYKKALPMPNKESKPYWDAAKKHRLVFQTCKSCGRARHYPQPACRWCGSFDYTWKEYKGGGKVYAWTVVHQCPTPGFADEVPYNIVVVELDNGVRISSTLRDADRKHLKKGQPVKLAWEDVTPEYSLPVFEPV